MTCPGSPAELTGDPRFFARSGPFGLRAVVEAAQAQSDPSDDRVFTGVAPLQTAGATEVSFLDNRRYFDALSATRAGAVIVHPDLRARVPTGCAALVTSTPYPAWARVAALFHPRPAMRAGIHPTAVIGDGTVIDPSVEIGPHAVIGAGVEIGEGVRIGPGAVIGDGVVLGAHCQVGALVSISHALVGSRVVIYPGARIGQDGFGFAETPSGFLSVPQLGRVVIGDDVEIGANSTIDRGSAHDTLIGAGSRLDNLVQIGHNVRLGRCCVVVAQAGVSGSTVLEDFVVVAAQAGLAGHLRIGARARIGAQAGVMADIAAGLDVVGSPAMPVREFFRNVAVLRKLARRPTSALAGASSGTAPSGGTAAPQTETD